MRNDALMRFRLPAKLKADAEAYAERNRVSVGAYLRGLLEEHLYEEALPPPKPLKLTDGTVIGRK